MKKFFTAIFALILTISCYAEGINTDTLKEAGLDKLTESQKAELVKTIEAQSKSSSPAKSTAQTVDEWVNVGTNIGKGLAGAARETGTAVNEFAKTPVGMLTTALIVWKCIGSGIFGVFIGLVTWGTGFSILHFIFKKRRTEFKYNSEGKIIEKHIYPLSGDAFISYTILNVIVFFTGFVVIVASK